MSLCCNITDKDEGFTSADVANSKSPRHHVMLMKHEGEC